MTQCLGCVLTSQETLVVRHESVAERSFRRAQSKAIDAQTLMRDDVVKLMQTVGYDICITLVDGVMCGTSPHVANHGGKKAVLDTVIRMLQSKEMLWRPIPATWTDSILCRHLLQHVFESWDSAFPPSSLDRRVYKGWRYLSSCVLLWLATFLTHKR